MESVAKRGASAMLFIELLFWKQSGLAAEIRDEYNWRVSICSWACMPASDHIFP